MVPKKWCDPQYYFSRDPSFFYIYLPINIETNIITIINSKFILQLSEEQKYSLFLENQKQT